LYSILVCPTLTYLRYDRVAATEAPRPGRGRADRAALVLLALVAIDVRERAREAVFSLPRSVRSRRESARRVPHHLPLRRRLARDEHRGRARLPAARRRHDAAPAAVRAHRREWRPRLHARGARLEQGGDHPL